MYKRDHLVEVLCENCGRKVANAQYLKTHGRMTHEDLMRNADGFCRPTLTNSCPMELVLTGMKDLQSVLVRYVLLQASGKVKFTNIFSWFYQM